MAVFESYTSPKATGATKEDLDPKLNLLAQMETPFYSSIGRGTTTNRYPDLIQRGLQAANAANAISEGGDFASEPVDGGDRRTFNTQIFRKGYEVTGTEQATDSVTYEGKKRLAELRAIHGLELKRDMEAACVSSAAGNAGAAGSTGTARRLGGLFNTNAASRHVSAANTFNTATRVDTGTAFESQVNTGMRRLLDTGGITYKMGNSFVKNANYLLMSPRAVQEFHERLDEKSSTYRATNSGGMLGVEVTKYGSSFGPLMVCPDIHVAEGDVAIINPMNFKWITLRPTHEQEIAKIGDAERRQLVSEGTLMSRHTDATYIMTNVTYAA